MPDSDAELNAPSPVSAGTAAEPAASPADAPPLVPNPPVHPARLWAWALGAAAAAAIVGWALGEMVVGTYVWNDATPIKEAHKAELSKMGPYAQTDFITKAMRSGRSDAEARNASLEFGILGAVLGLALGLAGGLAGRSGQSGLRGGVIGMFLAVVGTVILSFLVVPLYFRFLSPESSLALPLLSHAGLLLAAGAAGGLAFGLALGDWNLALKCLLGAAAGSAIAAVLFEVVAALTLTQEAEPSLIPSDRTGRLVLCLMTALLVAVFAVLGAMERKPAPQRVRP